MWGRATIDPIEENLPGRTGSGESTTMASMSTLSSSSSSGAIVSSDCTDEHRFKSSSGRLLTMGFFLGFREVDLRRPLTVISAFAGVPTSVGGVAATTSSDASSSDATSSCDCKHQCCSQGAQMIYLPCTSCAAFVSSYRMHLLHLS